MDFLFIILIDLFCTYLNINILMHSMAYLPIDLYIHTYIYYNQLVV